MTFGSLSFDVGPAIGRDLPLAGHALPNAHKLGFSAAWGMQVGAFTPTVAGVVENGAPRLDVALDVAAAASMTLAFEIEDVVAPQVRVLLEWTL